MSEFIYQDKTPIEDQQEKEIVEKALKYVKPFKVPVNHGYTRLPFSTVDNFMHDIKSLSQQPHS